MAVDWVGIISILAVTLLLLLGIDFGGAIFPWSSPKVICLIVFGSSMIAFFLYSQKRLATYPLIPVTIFNSRSNKATFLVAIAHNMVAIGQDYYLPLYFQSVKLASPLKSGILIIPKSITGATVDIICGIIIHRTGRYRELTWVGVALMTLGIGLYTTFNTDTATATIIGLEIVGGAGAALLYQTPTLAIQNSVSQADTASAIAALGSIGNVATAFSVVLGGVVFQNSMAARQSTLFGLNATVLEAFSPANAIANVDLIKTLPDSRVVQDAFAWSIRNMFVFYAGVAGVAIAASVFMEQKHMSSNHTETKTGIENLTKLKSSATR